MKTPNATPKAELKSTPWKVVGPHRRNGIIDTYSIESAEGFSVTINNHALDKEDAAHIVKCVNSHEELIKAFRHVTECPDRGTCLCGECAGSYRAVERAEGGI